MSHAIAYIEKSQLRMSSFDFFVDKYTQITEAILKGPTTLNTTMEFISELKQTPQDVYVQCGPSCVYLYPPKDGEILAYRYLLKNATIENITFSYSLGEVVIYTINLKTDNPDPTIGRLIEGTDHWIMKPNFKWDKTEKPLPFPDKILVYEKMITKTELENVGINKDFLDKIPLGLDVRFTLPLYNQ